MRTLLIASLLVFSCKSTQNSQVQSQQINRVVSNHEKTVNEFRKIYFNMAKEKYALSDTNINKQILNPRNYELSVHSVNAVREASPQSIIEFIDNQFNMLSSDDFYEPDFLSGTDLDEQSTDVVPTIILIPGMTTEFF